MYNHKMNVKVVISVCVEKLLGGSQFSVLEDVVAIFYSDVLGSAVNPVDVSWLCEFLPDRIECFLVEVPMAMILAYSYNIFLQIDPTELPISQIPQLLKVHLHLFFHLNIALNLRIINESINLLLELRIESAFLFSFGG